MRNPLAFLFSQKSGNWDQLYEWMSGGVSASGARVSEESAMRVAAVRACVQLISQTVASLPLKVYQSTSEGKTLAPSGNTLARVLRKPNPWQTSMALREQLTAHMVFRGNGFAWINWGKSPVDPRYDQALEIIPLNPDAVEVTQTDWRSEPLYQLRTQAGPMRLPNEEVFHLVGFSTNGFLGRSVLSDARDVIGVSQSAQEYAARFWSNDATPGIVLKHPARLSDGAAKRIQTAWDAGHAGSANARRTAVLEEGMTLERLTLTAADAQFLETRQFQKGDIATLFMVPPHMIGDTTKSTSWGTGIQEQMLGFLAFTLRPWLTRWEQAITQKLVLREDNYFAEHVVEGLLRGNVETRFGAYATARQWGWMSVNDIRRLENLNPIGAEGDVYLQPLNMVEAGKPPADPPAPTGASE